MQMSTPGLLNSTFLAPWGGQLVPCKSRHECTFVNGTQVAGLVYNVVCATLAEAETLPNHTGYCVCPPYQLRGGPTCSDETSLALPIAMVETVTGLIVDVALFVVLCKFYKILYKTDGNTNRIPKRFSKLFVQLLLLSSSAVLYVLGHCFQLSLILAELSPDARFVIRVIYVLFILPFPLLLAVGAVLLLAARFHLIVSTLSRGKNAAKSSGFITTAVIVIVSVASSIGLIGLALVSGNYSFFGIVILTLIVSSSAYFAIAIRYTISRLEAQSKLNMKSTPNQHPKPKQVSHKLALLLSDSVKRYILINMFGIVFLVTALYMSTLPRETEVDITKLSFWTLTPFGLGTRLTTVSIAIFLYELESNAVKTTNNDCSNTNTNTTKLDGSVKREKPASQPEIFHVEQMYEKGPTEMLEEKIVTVC